MDTLGNPLNGVKIYCLFNYNYIPPTNPKISLTTPTTDSLFENKLFQNFPNPVFYDTYIRYSVRSVSVVDLEIQFKINRKKLFTYTDTLQYGLYQNYLGYISNDTNFINGIYNYTFKVHSLNGNEFFDEKEMLIIGTENKPNAVSDDKGKYFFNSDYAFIGDTVTVSNGNDPNNTYKETITDFIYFLFKKDGYVPKIIGLKVYQDILFSQDVVLEEEGN